MQHLFLLLACYTIVLHSCAQGSENRPATFTAIDHRASFDLGEKKVEVVISRYGDRKDIVMLNLHDDERTSVEAARKVIEETGGILIRIENDEQRMLSFMTSGKEYRFDPNRMFTQEGRKASITKNSLQYTAHAEDVVHAFSNFILSLIPDSATTLIALHNNDAGRLTIDSYKPGGQYVNDAEMVFKSADEDPDNFFLTTDRTIFYKLVNRHTNVILQQNEKAFDDGSLSVYYGRKGKSYVNVEAEVGQKVKQSKMIEILLKILLESD